MDGEPRQYLAHVPEGCKAGLEAANAGKPLAELKGDASSILERIRGGESVMQVSESLGVSDVALYGFLLRHAPDQWQELSAGKALKRLEKARTDLDDAGDQLTVSRAREVAKLAQWDLERSARKLYGDNKQDSQGVTVNVLIARDGIQTNVVEPA